MITDERCLKHVGFDNYANTKKRKEQKDEIPENAERVMVLIDKERGTLTQSELLLGNPAYAVQGSTKLVELGDVYRVHDHNYLKKIIDITNRLKRLGETG